MPMKTADFERLLVQKFGFSPADNKSVDHRHYVLHIPGLPLITTKVSHGMRDLSTNLEGKIARQLHVHAPFFRLMMACTRSREEYYEQVQADPYPPFN